MSSDGTSRRTRRLCSRVRFQGIAEATTAKGATATVSADQSEKRRVAANFCEMAEGVGFEPTIRFHVYTLSKRAPSTARPSLRLAGLIEVAPGARAPRGAVAGGKVTEADRGRNRLTPCGRNRPCKGRTKAIALRRAAHRALGEHAARRGSHVPPRMRVFGQGAASALGSRGLPDASRGERRDLGRHR